MQSNAYTIGFAAAVTVICSLLLSGVSGALKERQDENKTVDRQRNILVALGFPADELEEKEAVQSAYAQRVVEAVVDKSGSIVEGKTPADLPKKIASGEQDNPALGRAIYSLKSKANPGMIESYAYPATGKGLWSTLYGYLAVKPDGDEIVGLSFYKHGETPGLGANIEKDWFRDNFIGKRLFKDGKLYGVTVVKGKSKDQVAAQDIKDNHMVDGMSGATITGNGVTAMMKKVPRRYASFFANLGKTAAAPAPKLPAKAVEAPTPVEDTAAAGIQVPPPGGKAAPAVADKAAPPPPGDKAAPPPVKKAAPPPGDKAAPPPVKKAAPPPVKKAAPPPVKKAAPPTATPPAGGTP